MTGLPKKKLSRTRRGKRTAARSYQILKLTACPNCGNLKMSHYICPSCGYYKERLIVGPKDTTKVTKVKEK